MTLYHYCEAERSWREAFMRTSLRCSSAPGSCYTPAHLHNARCLTQPRLPETMAAIPQQPKSAPVNPSTRPPSTDHILPAEADKARHGGSIYKTLFSEKKHTRCHIFPHRMCLHFRFSEALLPVVIFRDNGDSPCCRFTACAEGKQNVY